MPRKSNGEFFYHQFEFTWQPGDISDLCPKCGRIFPRRIGKADFESKLLVCPRCYDIPHYQEEPGDGKSGKDR